MILRDIFVYCVFDAVVKILLQPSVSYLELLQKKTAFK